MCSKKQIITFIFSNYFNYFPLKARRMVLNPINGDAFADAGGRGGSVPSHLQSPDLLLAFEGSLCKFMVFGVFCGFF